MQPFMIYYFCKKTSDTQYATTFFIDFLNVYRYNSDHNTPPITKKHYVITKNKSHTTCCSFTQPEC